MKLFIIFPDLCLKQSKICAGILFYEFSYLWFKEEYADWTGDVAMWLFDTFIFKLAW